MKKLKIIIITAVILGVIMAFTSPGKDAHIEKYRQSQSIASIVVNAVLSEENYSNLLLFSFYKQDDYFSLGIFGKVFVLQSK